MGKRSPSLDADGVDPIETSPTRRTRSRCGTYTHASDDGDDDEEQTSSSSSTSSVTGRSSRRRRMRAMRVEGHDGRPNQLLVSMAPNATSNVVYFPGDVQDFEHRLRKSRFKAWTAYSYEATALSLAAKFPDATIWIVQPATILPSGVSCYEHFLLPEDHADPIAYVPHGHAMRHLQRLMQNASECIDNAAYLRPDLPLHLVGFSRGVVVLNQMITELAAMPPVTQGAYDAPAVRHWFQQVVSIHWVDGGNGSSAGALPSHSLALSVLSDFPTLGLHVHWTPYQLASRQRPWIAHENVAFCKTMEGLGCPPRVLEYFSHKPGSLEDHFGVLDALQIQSTVADDDVP
ncbi:hypothetical protein SDRG_08859 [Saprolegnia diclina VS20]|uniref:Uncharacterized protein n=1 Tax=Saprolegnia diclina (strain VS20) TaxID=1156394 RepID=T0RTT4_SAPDV|nr:hypothetical protein SDRG_08859 [Saprolegnia diclina VS20]EQC33757.1 hypothetical protein SDRG_08859 [Saprolegnia diclina VS20]|eukprot:XP_008612980.1 hypothetical protein SDRG_08859 [Saprolegnia diclina VS20]